VIVALHVGKIRLSTLEHGLSLAALETKKDENHTDITKHPFLIW